ncbi:MAG: hypothetical protein APR53_02030 [Methanoculleus sp. SDB]|nr:MAG: hypothetical protein APR53_02030 [Methanoculleus sp. SDB]
MLGAIVCLMTVPGISGATPNPGNLVLAQDSDVAVIFVSSNCGYTNPFRLDSPISISMGDKSTNPGTTFSLGTFSAGTELIFAIESDDGTFYTGPASRNSDNYIHADVTGSYGNWLISWEDLKNGGDNDYNDIVFRAMATPVGTPVPEFPSPAVPMILAGLIGGCALFATRKAH